MRGLPCTALLTSTAPVNAKRQLFSCYTASFQQFLWNGALQSKGLSKGPNAVTFFPGCGGGKLGISQGLQRESRSSAAGNLAPLGRACFDCLWEQASRCTTCICTFLAAAKCNGPPDRLFKLDRVEESRLGCLVGALVLNLCRTQRPLQ